MAMYLSINLTNDMTYDETVMSIIESLCTFQSVKKDITTSYCNSEWLVMENDAVWQCNDC